MLEGESNLVPQSRPKCPAGLDPASRRVLCRTCFSAFGGLRYYGYRWSDPVTGRWPSRDPIGERGGTNLYVFVENNALSRVDSKGETWQRPPSPPAGKTSEIFPPPPGQDGNWVCVCKATIYCGCTRCDSNRAGEFKKVRCLSGNTSVQAAATGARMEIALGIALQGLETLSDNICRKEICPSNGNGSVYGGGRCLGIPTDSGGAFSGDLCSCFEEKANSDWKNSFREPHELPTPPILKLGP